MIDHIEGRLVEKGPTYAVISSAGVGYQMNISLNTFSKLGSSESCKLYAEQVYVRDDMPRLYGRSLFRQLISVSGVGGNSAMMMLSSLSAQEIQQAIVSGNVPLLKSIKGIGEKTAQRIIVDLKGKMGKEELSADFFPARHNTIYSEALSALVMLGFAKNIAEKALDKAQKTTDDQPLKVEELIKIALKNL
jgi:holliday junction DNA helicase RuvA